MPFSPIDLQVSFQQAGRVADESASANESKERAQEDKAREEIERRRIEENISDESDQSQDIDEETTGHAGGYHSTGGEGEEEEEQEDEEATSPSTPEDPEKGSFLDVTT